jgi:hypothetical protein
MSIFKHVRSARSPGNLHGLAECWLGAEIIRIEVESFITIVQIKLMPPNVAAQNNSFDSNRGPLSGLFGGEIPQLIQSDQLFRSQPPREPHK